MKYWRLFLWAALGPVLALLTGSCIKVAHDYLPSKEAQVPPVTLEGVAQLLSSLPLGTDQMQEVHAAASSSAANGYDEEYRMQDLFAAPGTGVGEEPSATKAYTKPLRELLREAVLATKAGEDPIPEAWLDSLAASDVQIYWPFSETWSGQGLPVVTFDPGDNATLNTGYSLRADGRVEKVIVDEQMARDRPVWVVNRNSDAEFRSLELLRREDPSWGQGGGGIVIKPKAKNDFKTLILRSFKANRQFDSWFSGGSEFFCKIGSVEDFRASTEAELKLYQPSITDFMIVVRRSQVGEEVPVNTVLVSEWTSQLNSCALMLVEDDGGTVTTWKCTAMVKYNSRSYGFELEFPLNSKDDIVWRGSLTRSYIERYNGTIGHFGEVEMVLELI